MLLGVTGSIAAYKAALLARHLIDAGADVRVILTPSAERFVGADTFAALTGNPVH
ncbi:MAG: flavoprotein, partial [Actinomycetota bacterium]